MEIERHLNVDMLLGIMRSVVLERRPELKVVLMSATLQKDLFVNFFGLSSDAVVEIPGTPSCFAEPNQACTLCFSFHGQGWLA